MENIQQNEKQKRRLFLSTKILKDFQYTTYWGSFISTFSIFIISAFTLFFIYFTYRIRSNRGLSFFSITDEIGSSGIFGIIILAGFLGLYIMSSISLWNFSTEMKKAIQMKQTSTFDRAISHLFSFFKYVGILFLAIILACTSNYLYYGSIY